MVHHEWPHAGMVAARLSQNSGTGTNHDGKLVLRLWVFLFFWQDILHRYPLTDIIHFLEFLTSMVVR